tara:strand:+ start:1897 stop:2439 length:543 start_codon:yes stop_codon:yes gene_type:complete
MRSLIQQNKRGQIDSPIIAFAVLVIGLMILAPVLLKVFLNVDSSFGNALGNTTAGGDVAKANFKAVSNTLVTFWDKVIIAAFFVAILLLLVSAFFIDAHPFFIVLYILLNFFLILFAPTMITAIDNIYDSADFAQEIVYLSFLDTLRNNFTVFLVGMMVITGIIIYGKLAFFGGRANNRR